MDMTLQGKEIDLVTSRTVTMAPLSVNNHSKQMSLCFCIRYNWITLRVTTLWLEWLEYLSNQPRHPENVTHQEITISQSHMGIKAWSAMYWNKTHVLSLANSFYGEGTVHYIYKQHITDSLLSALFTFVCPLDHAWCKFQYLFKLGPYGGLFKGSDINYGRGDCIKMWGAHTILGTFNGTFYACYVVGDHEINFKDGTVLRLGFSSSI